MKVFNVFDGELEPGEEPPGYGSPYAKLGENIGATKLAATVAVIGPDEWVCPYHYEISEEEWLFVLEGSCVVRHPEGEDTVRAGEIVCFPRGPAGAHQIGNTATEPARILIISDRHQTEATVYPSSDKVGVFAPDVRLLFRREDARDYWDREPDPRDPPSGR
jgi:uncharacterized cupin superfamily protein